MKISVNPYILSAFILLVSYQCKGENSIKTGKQVSNKEYLYSQVDQARIRKQSGLSGKAIGFLKEGEKVVFLGEESRETAKVTLRGKEYNTAFLKIETLSGVTGWVYGGALSKEVVEPVKIDVSNIEELHQNIYIGEIFPSGSLYVEKITSEQLICGKPVEDKNRQSNIEFFVLNTAPKTVSAKAKFFTSYCGYLPKSEESSVYFSQPFSEPRLALLHYQSSAKPEKTSFLISIFHNQVQDIDQSLKGQKRPYSKEEYKKVQKELNNETGEEDRILEKPTLENTIVGAKVICLIQLKNSNLQIRLSKYIRVGMEYVAQVYVTDYLINNKIVKTYEKENWDGPM